MCCCTSPSASGTTGAWAWDPAAIILALLGLAVGAAWLYWLLGGVGWPMAAANVPVAMFIGFAMVLAWYGDDLFDAPGVPRLLAELSAIFGIVAGVFLDSPRRWRWDQRQRLRPGTKVPRVSPTTQAIVAQMPRSMPRRRLGAEPASELAARIERSTPHLPEPNGETVVPPVGVEPPAPMPPAPVEPPAALAAEPAGEPAGKPALKAELSEAPAVKGSPIAAGVPTPAAMPDRRQRARCPPVHRRHRGDR